MDERGADAGLLDADPGSRGHAPALSGGQERRRHREALRLPERNAPVARAAGNCGNRPRGGLPTPLPRLARDRLPRDRRPEKREVRVDRERASEPRLRRRAPETALDHRAVEDEERVARPQPERPDRMCPRSGAVAGAEEPPRDRILGVDAGPGGVGRAGARQGVGHVPVVVGYGNARVSYWIDRRISY